jgi:iron complex transport system ATP-binding protein
VLGGRYAHFDFFRTPRPADREAVERALAEADASDWGERLLGELSGGERQRALIARALAQESAALLLDEPTASLDPEHQLKVMRLVRSLADRGRAVAVVTHDLNLASQYGDRLTLMHRGRIAAEGAARDVLCADVLEPVYGPGLHFGAFPNGAPLVLPQRD